MSSSTAFPALILLVVLGACRCQTYPLSQECTLINQGNGSAGSVPFTTEVVAKGLEVPWGLAFLPRGDVLVTERPGRVRLLREGQLVPQPVANVRIANSAEGGLLGIAAHPDFASNRLFYLYVTTDVGGKTRNRVERWVLAEDHASAAFDRVILDDIPSAAYHDGGRLRFGPDGMLYVGTGDARDPELSQKVDSLAGKLLRITPEGDIPEDNPFPGKAAFITGIRNTQGFDWKDKDTLYVTDHGPSGDTNRRGHDEVSVAKKGDNLGWPTVYSCETKEGLVSPSLTWEQAVPPGGAAVYTGDSIAEWKGSLLVGALRAQHLHRVVFDAQQPHRVALHEVYLQDTWGRLREVTLGPDRHLYVTTSNCDGRGRCGADKDVILRLTR
jgi:aldose sugar dehydrogenase